MNGNNNRLKGMIAITLVIAFSLTLILHVPIGKAEDYYTEYSIIQVRTQKKGMPLCTFQLWTRATTYEIGPVGPYRILDFISWPDQFHFAWIGLWPFAETKYAYYIYKITWVQQKVQYVGTVAAGSVWSIILYERNNPNNGILFNIKSMVVGGGGTRVSFTPLLSSDNGWTHIVEEVNWITHEKKFIGKWLQGNPA